MYLKKNFSEIVRISGMLLLICLTGCSSNADSSPPGHLSAATNSSIKDRNTASAKSSKPELTYFHFISDQFGWGTLDSEYDRIFVTEDGGNKWKDITPSVKNKIVSCSFLNSHVGWVVSRNSNSMISILHTIDGGETWVSTPAFSVHSGDGGTFIHFLDPKHGYLALFNAGMIDEGGELWNTADGGTHWNFIGTLYPSGKLTFTTPNIGWKTGGEVKKLKGDGKAVFYKTRDAGKSWTYVHLNKPKSMESSKIMSVSNAVFSSKNKGLISVQFSHHASSYSLYRTTDSGKTWSLYMSIKASRIHFINPKVGWAFEGSQVLHTSDGGKSWNAVTVSNNLPTNFLERLDIVNFISKTTAFAMYISDKDHKDNLYKTVDGGHSWNHMKIRSMP